MNLSLKKAPLKHSDKFPDKFKLLLISYRVNMKKSIFVIFLTLWAVFQLAAQSPSKPDQNVPTKPSIAVTFEKQTIREDDTVQVQIWFSNEWEQDLTDVVLQMKKRRQPKYGAYLAKIFQRSFISFPSRKSL